MSYSYANPEKRKKMLAAFAKRWREDPEYRARHLARKRKRRKTDPEHKARTNAKATAARSTPEKKIKRAMQEKLDRRKDWPRAALISARARAKKKGIACTIKREDIILPRWCPVLGFELVPGGIRACRPSLDRINNNLGYIPGNIRVISMRANSLKSDATVDELEKVLAYAKGQK